LLAHELTHVVQQRSGRVGASLTKPVVDTPGDAWEREADAAAEQVAAGRAVSVGRAEAGAHPHIQRYSLDDLESDVGGAISTAGEGIASGAQAVGEAASSAGQAIA